MEYGSIERVLHIEATPEVVFEVISRPEHIRQWWPEDASLDPRGEGTLTFRAPDGTAAAVPMKVLQADPPRLFQFRWAYEAGVEPTDTNSFLVTFELEPSESGTTLQLTETGFREQGWDAARVEATYREHAEAWDHFMPRLRGYASSLRTA